ncbi:hypothetical protein RUM44_006715 [Polyplax serrata]|uniref:Uncharacterized protein n=1 Tax=Polyplax serrata TaxID=468196 RepID=A0ABR1AIX4_POLSC
MEHFIEKCEEDNMGVLPTLEKTLSPDIKDTGTRCRGSQVPSSFGSSRDMKMTHFVQKITNVAEAHYRDRYGTSTIRTNRYPFHWYRRYLRVNNWKSCKNILAVSAHQNRQFPRCLLLFSNCKRGLDHLRRGPP